MLKFERFTVSAAINRTVLDLMGQGAQGIKRRAFSLRVKYWDRAKAGDSVWVKYLAAGNNLQQTT